MPFLSDGYRTLVGLGGFVLLSVAKEKEVQPSAMDGTGPIDITTMRNTRMRTNAPKSLVSLMETTIQASYDPLAYGTILPIIQINMQIGILFPDGTLVTFYGWLDKFAPTSNKEGDFPLAEIKLWPSNISPGGESKPVKYAPGERPDLITTLFPNQNLVGTLSGFFIPA